MFWIKKGNKCKSSKTGEEVSYEDLTKSFTHVRPEPDTLPPENREGTYFKRRSCGVSTTISQ